MNPKQIAKQIKSKGLQRLRWYCQSCNKQMRDENGFKCHIATEGHQRQMQLFSENSGAYIESYSSQFLSAFTRLISSRYSQKPVLMNTIYQEYIQDKQHMHMNATRWSSFRDLANYMKKKGLCDYEDSDRGIIITWIDNSPHALERRAAMEKKEKSERSEEERAQLMLEEQMEKAKKNLVNEKETEFTELKRENSEEKIQIKTTFIKPLKKFEIKKKNNVFSLKKATTTTTSDTPNINNTKKNVENNISKTEFKSSDNTTSSSFSSKMSGINSIISRDLENNKRKAEGLDKNIKKRK